MATSFVLPEDAPRSEMDLSLTSPQLARFRNTEFNSRLLKSDENQTSRKGNNTPATIPVINISLEYFHAVPNPVKSGSSVTLTASFGYSSSNPLTNKEANNPFAGTNENPMTVNATIKNSAGAEVGKVNLGYLSDGNYLGIWKANVTAGVYNASIVTMASGKSNTFHDALQIEVI